MPNRDPFVTAVAFVLGMEGGFSDKPNDRGGRTNFGVTEAVYDPTGVRDVLNIRIDQVLDIYERDYWRAARCDWIAATRPLLAFVHFDAAVNEGVGGAAKVLQTIAGVPADGIVGGGTLAAVAALDDAKAALAYLERRKVVYHEIVARTPSDAAFLSGWLARLRCAARAIGLGTETLQ